MSAVDNLQNLSLNNNWVVTRHLARHPNGTGGTFSQSYQVERSVRLDKGRIERKVGFLKAFDFWPAYQAGVDTTTMIQILISAYNHERDVLEHCRNTRLSNIVLAIDHGSVQVPGYGHIEGRVFYLIFEMAAGDVRVQMDQLTACDAVWCMRALKDICLGLWQIHRQKIAHQDGKPSNILAYPGPIFKVADFGRSSWSAQSAPHDSLIVPGDNGYAPPELLFGYVHPEFIPRRMGCDLFMLGNLAAFLFSGVNVTARLFAHLDQQHHPKHWTGGYTAALPYLRAAFTRLLDELALLIDSRVRDEVLILISELCDPDIHRRGHPKGLGRADQYSLERYVTRLDVLARRTAIQFVRKTA